MDCNKSCVLIFTALVLSTAGFVLTITAWFAPPLNNFVANVRLAGPLILVFGFLLMILSCFLCSFVQGRCCACCYRFSSRKQLLCYREDRECTPDANVYYEMTDEQNVPNYMDYHNVPQQDYQNVPQSDHNVPSDGHNIPLVLRNQNGPSRNGMPPQMYNKPVNEATTTVLGAKQISQKYNPYPSTVPRNTSSSQSQNTAVQNPKSSHMSPTPASAFQLTRKSKTKDTSSTTIRVKGVQDQPVLLDSSAKTKDGAVDRDSKLVSPLDEQQLPLQQSTISYKDSSKHSTNPVRVYPASERPSQQSAPVDAQSDKAELPMKAVPNNSKAQTMKRENIASRIPLDKAKKQESNPPTYQDVMKKQGSYDVAV